MIDHATMHRFECGRTTPSLLPTGITVTPHAKLSVTRAITEVGKERSHFIVYMPESAKVKYGISIKCLAIVKSNEPEMSSPIPCGWMIL